MIPILYDSNEVNFVTNGLGALSDASSCIVTEERNGIFELEMEYPVDGIHYSDILLDRIILAKPSEGQDPQPFDIYKKTTPIDGIVTIYARHICYRTGYILVKPFESIGVSDTIAKITDSTNLIGNNPFTIISNGMIDTETPFKIDKPMSIRECIGNGDTSFLSVFGGEIKYNKFGISILASRGKSNGIRIAYSKNLTDLKQDEDGSETITGIYPYWEGITAEGSATNPDGIVYCSNHSDFNYERIVPVDFKNEIENRPSMTELITAANKYIEKNKLGRHLVHVKASFVSLWQTEEYKSISNLEQVELCDTVIIEHEKIGVDIQTKVISTEYDTLAERYNSIELGETNSTLENTIGGINHTASSASTKDDVRTMESDLKNAITQQVKTLTGVNGGYVITHRDVNGKPYETIWCQYDPSDPEHSDAKGGNCIRINNEGIGFSESGLNGTFTAAWTIDGKFQTQWIGSGTILGDMIKSGTLKTGSLLVEPESVSYIKLENAYSKISITYTNVSKSETIPTWHENTYYSRDGDNYILTIEKPQDWETSYIYYYTKDDAPTWHENTYYSKDGNIYTLTTEKPSDWETSYSNYYTKDNAPKYYKNIYYRKDGDIYILLEEDKPPIDWNESYTNYYYKDVSSVFGGWLHIGTDLESGKMTLIIGDKESSIRLVEKNDRISFIDSGTNQELAYISDNKFHAPNMSIPGTLDIGDYRVTTTKGLIFRWAGNT